MFEAPSGKIYITRSALQPPSGLSTNSCNRDAISEALSTAFPRSSRRVRRAVTPRPQTPFPCHAVDRITGDAGTGRIVASPPMIWQDFQSAAPDLADLGRMRFEQTHVALIAT